MGLLPFLFMPPTQTSFTDSLPIGERRGKDCFSVLFALHNWGPSQCFALGAIDVLQTPACLTYHTPPWIPMLTFLVPFPMFFTLITNLRVFILLPSGCHNRLGGCSNDLCVPGSEGWKFQVRLLHRVSLMRISFWLPEVPFLALCV